MTPEYSSPVLSAWPFWTLELTPSSTLQDVEKSFREIQGKLKLGLSGAEIFLTPSGPRVRDEHLVREARAFLIEPQNRLLAEFWYVPPESSVISTQPHHESLDEQTWRRLLGVS